MGKQEVFYADKRHCINCKKVLQVSDNFYRANTDEGVYSDTCKSCTTMHINVFEPHTFVPELKKLNVPYFREEWMGGVQRLLDQNKKLTAKGVFGRYLSRMRLQQFKNLGWEDSFSVLEDELEKRIQELRMHGFSQEAIEAQIAKEYDVPVEEQITMIRKAAEGISTAEGNFEEMQASYRAKIKAATESDIVKNVAGPEDAINAAIAITAQQQLNIEQRIAAEMTAEEKMALAIKWGPNYTPAQWVRLEEMYEDISASFEIGNAIDKEYVKLTTKTALDLHDVLAAGDIVAYEKLSKIFDSMNKSASLTKSQNKVTDNKGINSISEFVYICEKEGFIPRYYVDTPQDAIDQNIADMKQYTRNLVGEDMDLQALIEEAYVNIKKAEENAEIGNDLGFDTDIYEDMASKYESLDINNELDATILKQLVGDDIDE